MSKKYLSTLTLFTSLIAGYANAQSNLQESINDVSHRWATISYQTPEHDKEAAFDILEKSAAQVSASFPGKAEPLVWQAIVLSSSAKAEGGLGALNKVKQARQLLLDAEKIDPAALDGSIYSSLGSLYAKVPGWPIAFGDKKKAAEYFQKALAIDPDNIDTNYFYADLLTDQGEYANAVQHLKKAIAAPARPGRADADGGRRQEAQRMLEEIKQKFGNKFAAA